MLLPAGSAHVWTPQPVQPATHVGGTAAAIQPAATCGRCRWPPPAGRARRCHHCRQAGQAPPAVRVAPPWQAKRWHMHAHAVAAPRGCSRPAHPPSRPPPRPPADGNVHVGQVIQEGSHQRHFLPSGVCPGCIGIGFGRRSCLVGGLQHMQRLLMRRPRRAPGSSHLVHWRMPPAPGCVFCCWQLAPEGCLCSWVPCVPANALHPMGTFSRCSRPRQTFQNFVEWQWAQPCRHATPAAAAAAWRKQRRRELQVRRVQAAGMPAVRGVTARRRCPP